MSKKKQPPWTIQDAARLLQRPYRCSRCPAKIKKVQYRDRDYLPLCVTCAKVVLLDEQNHPRSKRKR